MHVAVVKQFLKSTKGISFLITANFHLQKRNKSKSLNYGLLGFLNIKF